MKVSITLDDGTVISERQLRAITQMLTNIPSHMLVIKYVMMLLDISLKDAKDLVLWVRDNFHDIANPPSHSG